MWNRLKTQKPPGVVAHAFNPKAERQAELCISGQLGLQCEFQDGQGYTVKPCLKKQNKETNKNPTKQQPKTQLAISLPPACEWDGSIGCCSRARLTCLLLLPQWLLGTESCLPACSSPRWWLGTELWLSACRSSQWWLGTDPLKLNASLLPWSRYLITEIESN